MGIIHPLTPAKAGVQGPGFKRWVPAVARTNGQCLDLVAD
jgi:hypothetical protein